jgi:hypothetical protein
VTLISRRLRFVASSAAVVVAGAAVLAIAAGTAASSSTPPPEAAAASEPAVTEPAVTEPAPTEPAPTEPPAAAPQDTAADAPSPAAQPGPDPLVDPAGPGGSGPESPGPGPGTEIPPVAPVDAAGGPGLPESEVLPPVLTGPAPETATAVGEVVDGFPAAIPIPVGSAVLTSDVAVENQRVRVSVTATTASSGAEVLGEYDSAFAAEGFLPAEAPAVGGSAARTYSRGSESVTVTVTPMETGGSAYSVLALLAAQE